MGGGETGCRSEEAEEESLNPDLPACHFARIRVSVMTDRDIPVWAQVPGGHIQRLHRDRGFLAHLVLFPSGAWLGCDFRGPRKAHFHRWPL